jgi:hypothetical protein
LVSTVRDGHLTHAAAVLFARRRIEDRFRSGFTAAEAAEVPELKKRDRFLEQERDPAAGGGVLRPGRPPK